MERRKVDDTCGLRLRTGQLPRPSAPRPPGAPPRRRGARPRPTPPSALPAVILALDGPLVAGGPAGERTIPASEFFTGFLETALAPDEMLTEIRLPKAPGAGWSYQKFHRRALDWAIVGVAAVRNGTTGVALVNMGSTPLRATAVEEALSQGASVADAALQAPEGTEPPTDL